MGRIYDCNFENITVSAAQDLISITGGTGKVCRIKSVRVGATNTSIPTAQMIQLRCRNLPATVTVGSGGAAVTPRPRDIGDAAATVTSRRNDTTGATTNGTATIHYEDGVHLYAGLNYAFPPGQEPTINPTGAFVFELLSTVSGTVAMSGGVTVEEIG